MNETLGESLFGGVPRSLRPYEPPRYCECELPPGGGASGHGPGAGRAGGAGGGTVAQRCGYAADVSNCDVFEGES